MSISFFGRKFVEASRSRGRARREPWGRGAGRTACPPSASLARAGHSLYYTVTHEALLGAAGGKCAQPGCDLVQNAGFDHWLGSIACLTFERLQGRCNLVCRHLVRLLALHGASP